MEACAAIVGDGDFSALCHVFEGGEDAAVAAPDVAVPNRREDPASSPAVAIRRKPELLRDELLGTVERRRMTSLIARHEDSPLDSIVEAGVDDVHRADYVSFYGVGWVVRTERDHLHGGSVDAVVRTGNRAIKPFLVPDIANEVGQARRVLLRDGLNELEMALLIPSKRSNEVALREKCLCEDGSQCAGCPGQNIDACHSVSPSPRSRL